MVVITHHPEALAAFDRVIWLEGGQIAQDGDAQTVIPAFTAEMTRLGGGDDLSDLPS